MELTVFEDNDDDDDEFTSVSELVLEDGAKLESGILARVEPRRNRDVLFVVTSSWNSKMCNREPVDPPSMTCTHMFKDVYQTQKRRLDP